MVIVASDAIEIELNEKVIVDAVIFNIEIKCLNALMKYH